MVETRPCKLSALVILSLPSAPYSEDELSIQLEIPKSNLRRYLWRWEHYEHVIQRNEIINGSPTYILTDYGREYLKSRGKKPKTPTPKALTHA